MKRLAPTLLVLLSLFAFSSVAQAQITAGLSPNNISNNGSTTVTLTGLSPNTTYTVKTIGVGSDPYNTKSNPEPV